MSISRSEPRRYDCSQQMLRVVGKCLGIEVPLETKGRDVQIDISPALMMDDAVPGQEAKKAFLTCGKNKRDFEQNFLSQLDSNHVYCLRTGINGGSGHWQTIFYNPAREQWHVYSTASNHFPLTMPNGKLSEDAKQRLLLTTEPWGLDGGQYSFLLVEMTPERLANATRFVTQYQETGEQLEAPGDLELDDSTYDEWCDEAAIAELNQTQTNFPPLRRANRPVVDASAAEENSLKIKNLYDEIEQAEDELNLVIGQLVSIQSEHGNPETNQLQLFLMNEKTRLEDHITQLDAQCLALEMGFPEDAPVLSDDNMLTSADIENIYDLICDIQGHINAKPVATDENVTFDLLQDCSKRIDASLQILRETDRPDRNLLQAHRSLLKNIEEVTGNLLKEKTQQARSGLRTAAPRGGGPSSEDDEDDYSSTSTSTPRF